MYGTIYLSALTLVSLSAHQAEAVDIKAYPEMSCNPSRTNIATATCLGIRQGDCCDFQVNVADPRAVYVGPFQDTGNSGPPGGVGNWHDPGVSTGCGVVKDAESGYNTVCMERSTTQNPWERPPQPARAQGGSWYSLLSLAAGIKAKKTDPYYGLPEFGVGSGFLNFRDDSWVIRKREIQPTAIDPQTKEGNSTWKVSLEKWQTMLDTEPDLQCKNHVYATFFGWEKEGTGVWVLDNVTDTIYNKLASLPPGKDSAQINANLQAVGATFYDHWEQHPHSLEVMKGVGASKESKSIEGVTAEFVKDSKQAEGVTKREEEDLSNVEDKAGLVAVQYEA